jgi:phosphoglycerate kinase
VKTGIEEGWEGMDGGPISIKERTEVIARAKTIMWNGPTGVIEFPQFRKSSSALLRDIIEQTKKGAISVVGGGDSVSLVHAENAEDKLSHVSTGGGASLELMEGTELPGVKHLTDVDKIK